MSVLNVGVVNISLNIDQIMPVGYQKRWQTATLGLLITLMRNYILQLGFSLFLLAGSFNAMSQSGFKAIPLPRVLRNVNQEFSGMAQSGNRVYLLPQYGNHKETRMDGEFYLYSLNADSIKNVISGADTTLSVFRTIKVTGLSKLPDSVKSVYQGFETLTLVGNRVYMAIETEDTVANCYLLSGDLDTIRNEVAIDHASLLKLKRPYYISNAGFESITWLPGENKLIAFYEFNANSKGNFAYLIDTSFKKEPEAVKTPFLYFRNTDATATRKGSIYAVNYYWDGDYAEYLNNNMVAKAENDIKRAVPSLKNDINKNPEYLKSKTFARIIKLKNYRKGKWKEVAVFGGFRNNWEGITLFEKGALIITDANRSAKQVTLLAYVEF